MSKKEKNKIFFIAWIVEAYKRNHNITGEQTIEVFRKHSIIEWLSENYDVLHTVSASYVISEINDIIKTDNGDS